MGLILVGGQNSPISVDLRVAVWLNDNALTLINVVGLRRARLVLGWVTVRRFTILVFFTKSSRPTQPGHPSLGRRNEYCHR